MDAESLINVMLWVAMGAIIAYAIVMWPFRNDLDPNLSIPSGLKKLEEQGMKRAKYACLLFVGACSLGVVASLAINFLKL